jgi:hypothetical protein
MTECAPAAQRGVSSVSSVVFSGLYMLVATILAATAVNAHTWMYLTLLPLVPAAVHAMCAVRTPRSPKFLLLNRHQRAAAREAVRFYHGTHKIVNILSIHRVKRQLIIVVYGSISYE